MYAGYRPWINQRGMPTFNIGMPDNFGYVAMAATNQVVVTCTRHAMAIMQVMRNKNFSTAQLQSCIHAVKGKNAVRFFHQIVDGLWITQIIALHDMYGETYFDRGTQGVATNQVPAMDNGFSAGGMGCCNGCSKQFGAVVTIGDDADFQFFFAVILKMKASAQLAAQL